MIDNFEAIKPLLVFPNDQTFYFVQILQRKKDHPPGTRLGGSNNNARLIKAYYITSQEHLEIHKEEIIKLCEVFNARACINLNPRNFEKAAFQLLQKVSNQMMNKDFYGVRKAYDSVLGHYHSEMDKRWLVDIDVKQPLKISLISKFIEGLYEEAGVERKVLACIETKNGYHLITHAFNMAAFLRVFPTIDVHKNNPTALYIP
jgi:hypothetical protein